MTAYEDDQLAFEYPALWRDAVVAFSAPHRPGKATPGVVMTRELLRDATMKGHIAKHLAALRQRLPRLRVLQQRELEIGGRPAGAGARGSGRGPRRVPESLPYLRPPR